MYLLIVVELREDDDGDSKTFYHIANEFVNIQYLSRTPPQELFLPTVDDILAAVATAPLNINTWLIIPRYYRLHQ